MGDEPALTADEWFEGKNANPKTIDLSAGYKPKEKQEFKVTQQPEAQAASSGTSTPKNEKDYQEAYHELRKENDELKNALSQRDVKIRVLEIELQKLKTDAAEQAKLNSVKEESSVASPPATAVEEKKEDKKEEEVAEPAAASQEEPKVEQPKAEEPKKEEEQAEEKKEEEEKEEKKDE